MELIKTQTNIRFMSQRKLAAIFSAILIIAGIVGLATRGLNLGLDFTGGTVVDLGYPEAVELQPIRDQLAQAGFEDVVVQHFGSPRDVLIRVAPQGNASEEESAQLSETLVDTLAETTPEIVVNRVEYVGPQIGDELTEQGALALFYALIGILIYIWIRFEMKFALGAVAALIHDVVVTIGIFALLQLDFDLTVLAALLAVIGYSLNDTVVVYDRIRENFRTVRKGNAEDVMNLSINMTLSRTIMTSLTTLIVLISLYVFGGEIIRGFAMALIIGVLIGTYSSIYVAGSVLMSLGVSKQDLIKPTPETDEHGFESQP